MLIRNAGAAATSVLSVMSTARRRISTVVSPTTFKSETSTSVSGPGHVWWKTSHAEQLKYNLPKFIGHSGSSARGLPSRVKGRLPENDHPSVAGREFDVPGLEKQAHPYFEDTHTKFAEEINHGEMSQAQANKLRAFVAPPVYETSGKKRSNCVHVHAAAARELGADIPHIPDHLTPQGIFEMMRYFRTGQ